MALAPRGPLRVLCATASVGALLVVGAACGSDSDTPTSEAAPGTTEPSSAVSSNSEVAEAAGLLPATDPNQELPPNDIGSLRRLYDPALATMGLRLTRGALIDTSNDGYAPSDSGTHLALYVEPLDDNHTDADYVEGLWTLSALVTPDVFARWSGVQSYDICQEPPPSVDDKSEPLPYTQINLTREVAESIDWANGDLTDLLAAARTDPDFDLVLKRELRQTPEYKAAGEAARAMTADSTTTTTTGS
jgi:hypothetical protein